MFDRHVASLFVLAAATVHCAPDADATKDANADDTRAGVTAADGTVFGTDGDGLNVRAEPRTDAAIVGHLGDGTNVGISCQVEGPPVLGNPMWDYLPDYGGYVADAYLYTGYASAIPGVPTCGEEVPDEGGACNGLDYAGECQGDVLVWCEDDAVRTRDCSAAGKSCRWQNDDIGFNCLGGGGGGSDGLLTVTEIVGGGYSITQPYLYSGTGIDYRYCNAYGVAGYDTHCGVDIGIGIGTPLYIPGDATVTIVGGPYYVDENGGDGELQIELADGTLVILGHMSEIWVGVGESVSAGQQAGKSGSDNGPHVHIEVRVPDGGGGYVTVDPMTYFGG